MHIHLDALGGVAGDMFVAAMLDAFPEFAKTVATNLGLVDLDDDVQCETCAHDDGVLAGHRFMVSKAKSASDAAEPVHGHHESHGHHQEHGHHHSAHRHTHWRELRKMLNASALPDPVKRDAIGIFHELATAEAAVHGRTIEDVTFHEVGNWDSIADIVAAATLIAGVGATSWSVGSLPIGRGWAQTDHGRLPVPAPATTLLLRGFLLHDDGHPGERVTPTGAAILRYLSPSPGIGETPRILTTTGIGFGSKGFTGMSNVLRVLAFEEARQPGDRVGVIQFEIDDQSGEELAAALDQVRADPNVIDVIQTPALGKKGRMVSAIRVLTRPESLAPVAELCFRQTTTLGVRMRTDQRAILPRTMQETPDGVRVKLAQRPGGVTAKAEIDDTGVADSQRQRTERRAQAEARVLEKGAE